MEKDKIQFIFNPFNVDIQYCLNNNISYIDVIIIKYINYCLSNYKMVKIKNVNEKGEEIEYVWLDIDTLCFSLQMLELSKISMIRRIAKMCDENKILKLVKCDEGTKFKKTYYSLPIDTINAINGYERKQCENSNSEIEFYNLKKETENERENTKVDLVSFEEQAFNEFWSIYPKKVNKQGTLRAFKKIKNLKTELPLILNAVERFKNSKGWQKDNGQFIPYPLTFINQRRWEYEQEETREDMLKTLDMSDWL